MTEQILLKLSKDAYGFEKKSYFNFLLNNFRFTILIKLL
jgi:hypothetical protein